MEFNNFILDFFFQKDYALLISSCLSMRDRIILFRCCSKKLSKKFNEWLPLSHNHRISFKSVKSNFELHPYTTSMYSHYYRPIIEIKIITKFPPENAMLLVEIKTSQDNEYRYIKDLLCEMGERVFHEPRGPVSRKTGMTPNGIALYSHDSHEFTSNLLIIVCALLFHFLLSSPFILLMHYSLELTLFFVFFC